jgi:hypothetical protein
MKGLAKGLMTVALLGATTACDGSPTAGSAFVSESDGFAMSNHTSSSSLTFSSTKTYDFAAKSEQSASGGVGGIGFAGSLTTSTPCVNVTATHGTRQNDVTVTVSASDNGNTCQQVITHNNYTGRVNGLAAGTYNFTVVHDTGGPGSTAWSGTVTVQ